MQAPDREKSKKIPGVLRILGIPGILEEGTGESDLSDLSDKSDGKGKVRFSMDLTAAPEMTRVPQVDLDLKDVNAVKAFLRSHFQGEKFTIQSDERKGIFVRNGLEATLKRRGAHRTALPGLKEIVENGYPVGYEDVDEKHEVNRSDLRGQFVYGALLEIADKNGNSQKYIATIKLDDTKADTRAHFKDISIKKNRRRSVHRGSRKGITRSVKAGIFDFRYYYTTTHRHCQAGF